MFIEPHFNQSRGGWIEIICGCMFSGKTEELIRRLNRATIARQKVEIFKPAVDQRYHEEDVVSHNATSIRSTPVHNAEEILLLSADSNIIGIDEAQFFDESIVEVCNTLANQGKRVVIAGLDMDYQENPFGVMPKLLAIAEFITKVHAICMVCGSVASYSYRLVASEEKVLLGEADEYEARCRKCFQEGLEVQDKATR